LITGYLVFCSTNFLRIETGEGFGEYALVSDDLRSASIISDEATDLMVVNKALYSRLAGDLNKYTASEKLIGDNLMAE
jgi:hypothetical protein